jgi:hypothetical protein
MERSLQAIPRDIEAETQRQADQDAIDELWRVLHTIMLTDDLTDRMGAPLHQRATAALRDAAHVTVPIEGAAPLTIEDLAEACAYVAAGLRSLDATLRARAAELREVARDMKRHSA